MKTRIYRYLPVLVAFLAFAATGNLCLGQIEAEPEAEETFKATFSGTALDMVMQEYGQLTGRTVLMAPGVSANITLKSQTDFTKSEYIDAIEGILAMNNIALVPLGTKFVKVVKFTDANAYALKTQANEGMLPETEGLASQVIELKHMDASEAKAAIESFKSPHGKIQPLDRINSLLLIDTAANVNRILEILAQIDQPAEARERLFVRPINNTKPSDIKSKLEEIIADLKPKPSAKPQVARPKSAGTPGIIRARATSFSSGVQTAAQLDVEKGIIRGQVKIVADDRTGVLIFITWPSNMEFFDDIVRALDVATAPDVSVQVYRLEFADSDVVAGMLNSLIGAKAKNAAPVKAPGAEGQPAKGVELKDYITRAKPVTSAKTKSKVGELSATNIKILPDKRTNALIVMASKSDHITIAEIIRDMDMMLSQVLIEAVILEVSLSDSLQTGVDWVQHSLIAYEKKANGSRNPLLAFTGRGGGGANTPSDATGSPAHPTGGGLSYYFTHFGLNLDAVIQAASSDDRTRILSMPVILTTDNTDAEISSTESIYVYKGQKRDQYGGTYEDFQTQSVGLTLKVKPQINENKIVMMTIEQKMSQPGGVAEPESGGVVYSERALTASIAVGDGETIILGGQVRKTSGDARTKIPVLGSIPLFGRLFNAARSSDTRTEVIVFITPYVLDTPSQIEAETARRKRSLDMDGLWKKGWSGSKMADLTKNDLRDEKRIQQAIDEAKRNVADEQELLRAAEAKKQLADEELALALEAEKTRRRMEEVAEARKSFAGLSAKWKKSLKKVDESVEKGKW